MTSAEMDKIGQLSKHRKFDTSPVKLIYPQSSTDKLKAFINSYRFLQSLLADIPEVDIAVKNKIESYLSTYSEEYEQSLVFENKLRSSLNFGRDRIIRKLNAFLIDNNIIINNLIDNVIPIGRVVKTYNPDETQGYY